jgi:predicted nucleic acid-binding protein
VRDLFVDTSGWMMLADGSDPSHGKARRARDAWMAGGGGLLSTDYVVDETLTLLRVRLSLDAAQAWWEHVSESRRLRVLPIDLPRLEHARAWFFGWQDKDFSFTDCTSFVVMREFRVRQALTSDKHFVQAGFQRVPKGA